MPRPVGKTDRLIVFLAWALFAQTELLQILQWSAGQLLQIMQQLLYIHHRDIPYMIY